MAKLRKLPLLFILTKQNYDTRKNQINLYLDKRISAPDFDAKSKFIQNEIVDVKKSMEDLEQKNLSRCFYFGMDKKYVLRA